MSARNKKESSKDVRSRKSPVVGVDGWHSQKLKKIGEVEGSLGTYGQSSWGGRRSWIHY